MPSHDARAVANKILSLSQERGQPLTLMQLIKLVYLANGWWLSYSDGEALTNTSAQAWQHGPVHPHVYKAFRRFGSGPVTSPALDKDTQLPYDSNYTPEQVQIIESVVENYGNMHAFKLSDIMHRPGTPWSRTMQETGQYSVIPNTVIKEHFDELRRQRIQS